MSFFQRSATYGRELEVPPTPKPHWCYAWSISKGFRIHPYTLNPSIFDSLCHTVAGKIQQCRVQGFFNGRMIKRHCIRPLFLHGSPRAILDDNRWHLRRWKGKIFDPHGLFIERRYPSAVEVDTKPFQMQAVDICNSADAQPTMWNHSNTHYINTYPDGESIGMVKKLAILHSK